MKYNKYYLYIIVAFVIILLLHSTLSTTKHITPTVTEYQAGSDERIHYILDNLQGGGPPKDGIPALEHKTLTYTTAQESTLHDDEIIFGVYYNDLVIAYPQYIMFWHEVVNIEHNNEKLSVTYCPLTQTVIGYKGYNLGVSGGLFNSNLVMYDRNTDYLLPQMEGYFIDTKQNTMKETPIFFDVAVTNFGDWKKTYPDTLVLEQPTAYKRNYGRNPYAEYYDDLLRVWFPLQYESDVLRKKDLIFGIAHNKESVAFLVEEFQTLFPKGTVVTVGGEEIQVYFDNELQRIAINTPHITHYDSFWFAWYAFYPHTTLIQ